MGLSLVLERGKTEALSRPNAQARESPSREGRFTPLTPAKFNSQVLAQAYFCGVEIGERLYHFLSLIPQAHSPKENDTIGGRDNKGLQLIGISASFIHQLGCFI